MAASRNLCLAFSSMVMTNKPLRLDMGNFVWKQIISLPKIDVLIFLIIYIYMHHFCMLKFAKMVVVLGFKILSGVLNVVGICIPAEITCKKESLDYAILTSSSC
jgi:hypothetical protein